MEALRQRVEDLLAKSRKAMLVKAHKAYHQVNFFEMLLIQTLLIEMLLTEALLIESAN